MKYLFPFLLFIVFTAPAFAEDIEGFRGYKWGDPPSVLGKREILQDDSKHKCSIVYKKVNDSLFFGDSKADSIVCYFFKNRLFRVDVNYSNIVCHQRLLAGLYKKYGDPLESDPVVKRWQKGTGEAFLIYTSDKPGNGSGFLWIYNCKVNDEVTENEIYSGTDDL